MPAVRGLPVVKGAGKKKEVETGLVAGAAYQRYLALVTAFDIAAEPTPINRVPGALLSTTEGARTGAAHSTGVSPRPATQNGGGLG